MKAIVVHEYGGPEVLKFEEYPDPVPGRGEVLVRVAAASVNPIELQTACWIDQGFLSPPFSGPHRGRYVGDRSEGWAGGRKLWVPATVCSQWPTNTYAELCVVKADVLADVPEGLDLIPAAALPLVTVTGNQLLAATEIKAGQTVMGRRCRRKCRAFGRCSLRRTAGRS
jgi:NADPH:quinone reductase-like Zn-dependent oxidoreductase